MRKRKSVLTAKTDTILSKKNIFIVLTIAVFLVSAVGSASAVTVINNCNFNANTPGEYYVLGQNITCNADDRGITIGAHDVTIDGYNATDCEYYWIKGNRGASDCTKSVIPMAGSTSESIPANHSAIINLQYDNLTIKNLEIEEFCTGIVLRGNTVDNNTVTGCKIHNCGVLNRITHGIHMVYTNNCTISKNEIFYIWGNGTGCSDGGNGIFMYGEAGGGQTRGWYNRFTCNYFHDNTKSGFFMKHMCMYCNISYNYATGNAEGGIVPMCSKSNFNTIEYNNMSNNNMWGFMTAGKNNTIRYNTANNNDIGIYIGSAGAGPGKWNNITNNTACGNIDDIKEAGSAGPDFADSNTCDSSNLAGACDWSCGANNAYLVPVYFDFDEDNYYSKDPADCSCGIVGSGECACCNPGLFNGSDDAMESYEASCNCQWTPGNDPNDCDDSVIPELTYTISGTTTPAADTVNITNLNNSKEWAASINGNFYTLTLNVDEDVNATERLQIVACQELPEHESNCNVSIHVPENIPGEDTNVNLTLNHYCLNYYPDYPYYTKMQDNWSGPAVMQACIGHYYDIGDVPSQAELNETGIANNTACNADLQYVDPMGMKETLNRNWMWPISRNYGLYSAANTTDGLNYMLHYTCYWQHLGPAPVPAYGDYSNWMVVRGIHTSEDPYPQLQGSYDIYGFWINDPNDGPESIGENSYKTVDQWTDEYYLNLTGVRECDDYQYMYVGLFEPPEQPDREVRLVPARPRLAEAITPMLAEEPMMLYGIRQLALEKVVKDDELLKIVQAAIDGVNEELVPFDSEFAEVFAKTVPGKPMLVSSDNGDYYVVPFNVPVEVRLPVKKMPVELERPKISGLKKLKRMKRVADRIELKPIPIEPIKVERTLVVVLVDAEDGSFKEASWVKNPVTYLPVSKIEAMKLALGEVLDELHVVAKKDARDLGVLKQKPTIELVYRDASPYYPDWKVTVNGKVFYVSQDGTVSN